MTLDDYQIELICEALHARAGRLDSYARQYRSSGSYELLPTGLELRDRAAAMRELCRMLMDQAVAGQPIRSPR